jgi:glycosyltransferase involved in cell wall biosynthesis
MRPRVSFNGKFLSARPTGVHRVARELITACDALLAEDEDRRRARAWRVVRPRDAHAELPTRTMDHETVGRLTWQFWEQVDLPRATQGDVLVSLCNLAPAFADGLTMIHDAQVFISPQSYSYPFRTWYQAVLPVIGRHSRRVLTVSEFSRRMLVRYGVARPEKISVIPNGVDHILATQADARVLDRLGLIGRPYVCALANTQRHKNIGILFEAFRDPRLAEVTLVLIGAAAAADFQALGMTPPPNAVWTGPIHDGEVRALFEAAVCMATPSLTEGFGLPPLEAMRVGCPAVVAPCGALPEVCADAADYADPHDPTAWAAAIDRLIASPSADRRRRSMARASTFTWRKSAEALLSLVEADAA